MWISVRAQLWHGKARFDASQGAVFLAWVQLHPPARTGAEARAAREGLSEKTADWRLEPPQS